MTVAAMAGNSTVIVIAKQPVPGRVKTRLCPPFLPEDAASLAAAAIHDTCAAIASSRCTRRIVALDGAPGPWLRGDFEVIPQPEGSLDVRLASAFDHAAGPTVIIGMDTPQITAHDIDSALSALRRRSDAVLGPAFDGGYWLLGLAVPRADAVLGVPMSTSTTGAAQRTRLDELGLHTTIAPTLRDVDTVDDATAVATSAPHTRFAATFRERARARCVAAVAR